MSLPDSNTAAEEISCDVLVVGYGPVGMMAAAILAHYGVDVVAVEKHSERYLWHRAGHFDGETMRIFQRLGIAEKVELAAQPLPGMVMLAPDGEVLARVESGQNGSGWKSDYLGYQPDYERAIDNRGRELGVRVLMNTAAQSIVQTDELVEAIVKEGPRERLIKARYVIGADGAGSIVRSAMGSQRIDLGFHAEPHLVLDFEFSDPDCELPLLPDAAQVLDPARPQLAGRWGGRRVTRWEFAVHPDEATESLESDEFCWSLVAPWGVTPEHGEFVRRAVYEFESSITDVWRAGRVFLMGDAAHTMPPHMGQGMQSGIRDAENLAWKLAAVLTGRADEGLLDSYQPEREPHVRTLIQMSSALGATVLMTDPAQVSARNEALRSGKLPPLRFPRLGDGIVRSTDSANALDAPGGDGRLSLQARVALDTQVDRLDNQLPKRGWRIVSRHPVPMGIFNERQLGLIESLELQFAHISRGASGPTSFWDIDAEYDRWYQSTGRRVFLERPDHYVFGTAETVADIPALLDELADVLETYGWHVETVKENA